MSLTVPEAVTETVTRTVPQSAARRGGSMVKRVLVISSLAAGALTLAILAPRLEYFAAIAAQARPHWPDLALFAAQPLEVQLHVLAALGGVGLGAAMMLSRKGSRFHRVAGWLWVLVMTGVAASSFLIVGLNGARWSYLHIFSVWWLVFLALAVLAARKHRVGVHRAIMLVLFYGSLLITGAFAFLPGRLMWDLFFG